MTSTSPGFARPVAPYRLRIASWAAMLMLASCASTPTRYFALPARPARAPRVRVGVRAIAVAPIVMPPGYGRLAFTYSGAGSVVHVARHARWVAPLGALMRLALARDMAARVVPSSTVRMPGQSLGADRNAAIVRVVVQRFLPDGHGRVLLRARWSVKGPGRGGQGAVRLTMKTPAGYPPETRAMGQAVARLARRIVDALRP